MSVNSGGPAGAGEDAVRAVLAEVILDVAGVATELDRTFFEAGLTSAQLVEVHTRLQARLGRAMPVTDLFQYPTCRALARQVAAGSQTEPVSAPPPQPRPGRSAARERRELRAWLRAPGER